MRSWPAVGLESIRADLKQATELMTIPKSNIRASKEVAYALLSRVYLNPSNPGVNMEAGTQIIPPDHPRVIYYIPGREIELNPNLVQNL